MNKQLFWTGVILQAIHLISLVVIGLSLIKWNITLIIGIVYVIFNIASLIMIFLGALKN